MSGKAGSIGGIVLGAVAVIAAAYMWNPQLALVGVGLIAGGIAGVKSQQPKTQNAEAAKAEDLQFANSSEGFPVPVIFGEQKVTPNFMNWEASTFRAVEGTIPAGGKGGGEKTQASGVIDYYLSFELALCMGPIDEIGQIISVPGDVLTRGREYSAGNGAEASKTGVEVTSTLTGVFNSSQVGGQILWADGETETITGFNSTTGKLRVADSGTKTQQRFQIYKKPEQVVFDDLEEYAELTISGINEGGLIRVYKGSETQTRISADDPYYDTGMNYRGMAWAIFSDFWIGRGAPTPKTYQFIIRRLPRCYRDNATEVTAIERRGSINPIDSAYTQANPAAVIYEILTNKLWGRGISSDLIDEDSFARCSSFFRAKNIGISMTLDSPEKLVTILDSIRQQLKIILSWNGGQWKMRCLLDSSQTAENISTLTSNEVEDLRVRRPMWTSTVNDLRAEFNSSQKFYKADTVHVQDQANIELTGRVNSVNISLRAFTDWNMALRHATRILMEMNYPAKSATFYMNRFQSQLEIGDTFRLVWEEWGSAAVTAYFTALKIEPMGKGDDRLKISALEDPFLSSISGVETSVDVPTIMAWEKITLIDYADLSLRTAPDSRNGAIFPITALELYRERLSMFGQKPSAGTIGAQVFWSPNTTTNFSQLTEAIVEFCVTAVSATAITNTNGYDRSASFVEFVITDTDEAATLLAYNRIQTERDHFENMEREPGNWMIIGEEVMKVGLIEQLSPTLFRARNVIRGMMETEISIHPSSSNVFFLSNIGPGWQGFGNPNNLVPTVPSTAPRLKAYPVTSAGVNQVGDEFYFFHEGNTNNQFYLGLRNLARSPELVSATLGGVTLTLIIRPRYRWQDAGNSPLIGDYVAANNQVTGLLGKPAADYDALYPGTVFLYGGFAISAANPLETIGVGAFIVAYSYIGDGKVQYVLTNVTGKNYKIETVGEFGRRSPTPLFASAQG